MLVQPDAQPFQSFVGKRFFALRLFPLGLQLLLMLAFLLLQPLIRTLALLLQLVAQLRGCALQLRALLL
ncbi:hypothetical protein [Chromobacterium vaccinii]|uniref:hypothetical protein n=1 Tax=Chromobacterium vaccinii TaxID=1108595 RepID=UPI000E1FEF40|nr:hypothetical protein [Chromobacterium vaccinii]